MLNSLRKLNDTDVSENSKELP
ncbi:MAG: hypothetical protein QG635_1918, partial [Bacteroidota bacterium]|nr:hypothetical protein [Bacteroidota bacterium]